MKVMRAALIFVLFVGANQTPRADDIDIYLNLDENNPGDALVMLNLDWRPNLGSTVCGGGDAAGCQTLVTEGFMRSDGSGGIPGDITFYDLIVAALRKVIDPLAGLKLGLMINHEHNNNCEGPNQTNCSNGGYVFKGFTGLDEDPATHTCPLLTGVGSSDPNMTNNPATSPPAIMGLCDKLSGLPIPQGMESHKWQGEELFFELYRYLIGGGIYNGHNGVQDYGTTGAPNIDDPADVNDPRQADPDNIAQLMWDTAVESGSNYISPLISAEECSKIFTINFMFQVSQQAADSDAAIEAPISQQGMGIDTSANNSFGPDRGFTNVLDFLHDADLADGTFATAPDLAGEQNVTSYFLVDPNQINQTTNGYARAGGTGSALPLSDDPDELVAILTDVFNQILSVSTALVAPSIPVNVFNQAESLPELYFALFEADSEGKPWWDGNLKKLKLGDDGSGGLEVQDVNGDSAFSATDGRIKHSAITYWTHAVDLPDPGPDDDFLAGKDGRTVIRGGAGGVIPGYRPLSGNTPGLTNPTGNTTETSTRKLFTEPASFTNGTPAAMTEFNADNATAVDLLTEDNELYETVMGCSGCSYTNPDTVAEAAVEELIKFGRGLDVLDEDGDTELDEARSWIMGAPLHSRPLPLTFSASDTRVVMATDDGVVHMFRSADADGVEAWGFIPRAVVPVFKRLKDDSAGTPIHPYTVDGKPTALIKDINGNGDIELSAGDKAYLYIGMRRGGKGLYALDVTDPDDPKMLWRIEKGAPGTDFAEIGQSWSTPRVTFLEVDFGSPTGIQTRPVLIFGGGYNGDDDGDALGDLGKDDRPPSSPVGTDDDEGNAIFIVDAETGELIWKAIHHATITGADPVDDRIFTHIDLLDSIPSEITVVDTIGNDLVDRGYVGTTGGDVFRLDLVGHNRSLWTVTKVLEVGRHFNAINADDRRFFHAPDFVRASDDSGDYDAVVIAAGDRPHPLGVPVVNW
ncbi:MAG: PilC/PilY family type IV pilus protein, partial [Gammaproteobacteria bacterium]|nr:PilC/PilY family type IV pilus protein [Gammaproteobacteria bacterium]